MSSPARLLFLGWLNRAAASTRPGACAALRTMPIMHVLLLPCHSQLLFKLCLFKLTASTRPDLVRVRVRFGPLFVPLPPSLAQLRRMQDTTRYDIN